MVGEEACVCSGQRQFSSRLSPPHPNHGVRRCRFYTDVEGRLAILPFQHHRRCGDILSSWPGVIAGCGWNSLGLEGSCQPRCRLFSVRPCTVATCTSPSVGPGHWLPGRGQETLLIPL